MTAAERPLGILKKFFGLKPGQSLTAFLAEIKELSDSEVQQLATGITNTTFTY